MLQKQVIFQSSLKNLKNIVLYIFQSSKIYTVSSVSERAQKQIQSLTLLWELYAMLINNAIKGKN